MRISESSGFHIYKAAPLWPFTAALCLGLACYYCLAGYGDGFVDLGPQGEKIWHPYVWDAKAVAYSVGLWLTWAGGMWVARRIADPNLRWGSWILLSLPVAVFVFLAFGLVELSFS